MSYCFFNFLFDKFWNSIYLTYTKVWARGFGLQFFCFCFFLSQRELHSVRNIDFFYFLLNYHLFCPNRSYQGQNYQNAPIVRKGVLTSLSFFIAPSWYHPLSLEKWNPPNPTSIPVLLTQPITGKNQILWWHSGIRETENNIIMIKPWKPITYRNCVLSSECVLIVIIVAISTVVGTGCNFPDVKLVPSPIIEKHIFAGIWFIFWVLQENITSWVCLYLSELKDIFNW